jgi:hypothetical protein
MPILDVVLRLGAALLLGACVGLERQWRQADGGHANERAGFGGRIGVCDVRLHDPG